MFQRQLAKEGLQQVVNNTAAAASAGSDAGDGAGIAAAAMSMEDLRDLFTLRLHTASDTFDSMCNADSDEAADTDAEDEGSRAPALPVDIHKDQARAGRPCIVAVAVRILTGEGLHFVSVPGTACESMKGLLEGDL